MLKKKKCSKCGKEKKIEQFSPRNNRKSGRASWCRECVRNALKALYVATDRKIIRGRNLKALYGISLDEFDALLEQQNGVCIICGNTNRRDEPLAVDHDHLTLEVRGLLCTKCNTALGCMGDNPTLLRKAANYLEGK